MPRQSSRRPPTSQSSRPSTAADEYAFSIPGTASSSSSPYYTEGNPQPLPAALHAHYSNYGYDDRSLDGVTEEEEEEESDAEDVFAYLPPTTADIERERQLESQSTPQQLQSPARFLPHPESPPDTNSSYDHIPQGPDSLRMRNLSPTANHQNIDTPSYKQGNPLDSVDPSSLNVKQTHVALPSPVTTPTAGPSSFYSYYFPGRAYDNPYQYQLENEEEYAIPSARASVFTESSDIGPRTNPNNSFIRRSRKGGQSHARRSTIESLDKDGNIKLDGMSISKLSQNDVGTLAYSGRSRRTEDGVDDVDWSTRDGSVKMEYDIDAMADEDSPYPEVRASVSNIDDPEMPALTFRMWLVGLILIVFSAAFNVVFNFRNPAPAIIPLVILLVTYPLGKFAAYTLPLRTFRIPLPGRLGGSFEISLNPGPFNIKEHVLIFMMSNIGIQSPYALNATVVGEFFYGIKLGTWFEMTLVLATQLTGMGLAGMCRRLLVYPASMVWPNYLVLCTLLNTLHAEDEDMSGGITRYRYFLYVSMGAFAFFFLPGYLFQALSVFSWICWIRPNNRLINQLFGFRAGMGLSTLTFDWTQITWIGSPLMTPWWAEVHVMVGFVLFFWILVPIMYYTNTWNFSYFPMAANVPFDRFGEPYNVSRVLTADNRFNDTAFREYSPLFLPAAYSMTYILALALFSCAMVHTVLYHGHQVWKGLHRQQVEPPDIHMKLMKVYPEVPDWWYLAIFVVFFCIGIVAIEVWNTSVPVWAWGLSVLLPVIYCIPSGYLYAMTGDALTLNLPAQIIPGLLLPGNPLANMVFKAYSVQTLIIASIFIGDMKLGHYIKVPPRATFIVQSVTTIVCAFVQVGVKQWIFSNVEDICSPNQKSSFTCPHNEVFYTASAIWGLIGPARQFGKDSPYHPQLYALLAGAFLPIPFYLWQRRFPKTRLKYINIPIMLNGCQYIPPANSINYSSWFFVAWIFQYLIRRRNFTWWSKFNYITSAAMDSGTTIALLVIFFALQMPKGGIFLNWWGNTVFLETADWKQLPFRDAPPDGIPGTGGEL